MKLRKLFAMLMSLVMLLGMMPAAHAQAIWCPDLGLEHAWSTPEYDYGPCDWGFRYCTRCGAGAEVPPQHKWATRTTHEPGCESPGYKESICSVCGSEQGNPEEIPALGHNWGNWSWVNGEPPCNSRGAWQVRECHRCGQQDDRWIEGGAHAFGPWVTTQEPTCTTYGRQEHTCTLCGYTEWTTIPQLEHVWGDWRVIEEPQDGIPGTERRACIYNCGTHEDRAIPPLKGETDSSQPQATKSIIGKPDNGEYYVPGEAIQFLLTLKNTCSKPIERGFFTDPLFPDWSHDTLYIPQGDSVSTMLRYIVTEEDAARGYVENSFTAQLYVADGYLTVTSNTVTVPCGPGEPENALGLSVSHTYTNTPANGEFFTPGEVIDYLITVTNTSSVTLMNLYVGNSSSEAVIPSPREIAPGQTIQVPYYKLVYEADAKAGGINSYAHAQAFSGEPATIENMVDGRSADLFVPCGKGDGTPSVYYLKTVNSAPANGLFYTEGETIKYRLAFGNNTKKDIYNITLNDPMANTRAVAFARRLKPGEFLIGEFEYVVTAADVEAGRIVNTGTSTWAAKAEGALTTTSSNAVVTPCGVQNPTTPDALLEKYVKNSPANGEYFVPGETIEYAVIFMNVCPHELHDVEVYDPLKGGNEDTVIAREPILEANGTLYLSFHYVVTEEDAARGTVVNTASALWLNPETEEWSSCDSNTVTTIVGIAAPAEVSVTKTVENTPANGHFFVPGEVIHFVITAQNNMNKPLDIIVLTDPLSADFYHEVTDIPAGGSVSRSFNYTVTELDAAVGSVVNYAYAVAYVDGAPRSLTSNSATAACGFPEGNDPYGLHSCLEVTKAVESLPANGVYYVEGEQITYAITFINAGETRLGETLIYDALYGMNELASAESLEPGDSRTARFTYTVTAADVTRGYVYNQATATYALNGFVNTVSSNPVITDTDGQPDPEYFDFVWCTPIPDVPGSGADHCITTLTGWNTSGIDTQTVFCPDHAATQDTIAIMMGTAADEDSQQRVYEYAIDLWQAELEKQYNAMINAADPATCVYLINEYVQFRVWAGNYQTMLTTLYPDQPALAAKLTAKAWQDKCIGLCCEAGTAPAQPGDSLFLLEQGTDAHETAASCGLTSTTKAGAMTCTDVFCQEHSFLFSMTSALLKGENTADGWNRLGQMWKAEMNKAYNAIYASADDHGKTFIMVERNMFENWLTARETELMLLYPNNPEIVAELLTREIMAHVADLCEVNK